MARQKQEDIKRQSALEALLQADTFTAAAAQAGISRKTLYNYLHAGTDFVTAYRDMKRAQLRETAEKVQAAADKATDFITGLLDNQEAPPQVKLAAAVKLLDLAATYRSIEAQINQNTISEHGGLLSQETPV